MIILSRLICKLRQWLKIKPIHKYVRRMEPLGMGHCRICVRCFHAVIVKPRGPRKPKTQEIQK